jgi:hypothetical protein
MDIIQEVTNDWVECFEKPENQNGFMWRMAAQGLLPECVDPQDERVKVLCEKAAQQCLQSDKSGLGDTPENLPSK